jgi:hypothetical protein
MKEKDYFKLKRFRYCGVSNPKRFRIVKLKMNKYRVEYNKKFLWFDWWEKKLYMLVYRLDDETDVVYEEVIFSDYESCLQYIEKAMRKIVCFKNVKPTIMKYKKI